MSSVAQEIKARLGVQDVIGSYLKLEAAGQNLKAKCPFHAENTPSFFVSPARNSYYCFGCNRGGDVFSFVQEIEGLDFREALKVLAARAGVPLTDEGTGPDPLKVVREIMEAATLFYVREREESQDAEKYLKSRGLTPETIKDFRIGYAPDAWSRCIDYLSARGYSKEDIERAGLSVTGKSGKQYDRFRQRIMFPINDTVGHVIAFTGRIIETAGQSMTVHDMATQGKYVNSPQTSLYSKSRVLYGFDKAKIAIRKQNVCILVEGQMDTIMSHQAGLPNTVAVSGTALTNEHLMLIKRLTNNLILAFDADTAGIASARRAVLMALELDMDVRVAVVPQGKDPADSIKEDPAIWRDAVKNSVHVIEYYLKLIQAGTADLRDLRKRAEHEILPFVARIKSHIDKAHFVSRIAQAIDLTEDVIWKGLPLHESNSDAKVPNHEAVPLTQNPKSRIAVITDKLMGILLWQEGQKAEAVLDTGTMRQQIETLLEQRLESLGYTDADERERLTFEAEARLGTTDEVSAEAERLLASLESELLRKKFQDYMGELKHTRDEERTRRLLSECQQIGVRLEILKKQTTNFL